MTLTQDQIDGLVKAQIGVDPAIPSPDNPQAAQYKAWSAQASAANVALLNNNLISNFNSLWGSFYTMVTSGHGPNTNPPQPPAAWAALKASNGVTYEILTTDPVCPMPAVPPMPPTTGGQTSPTDAQVLARGELVGYMGVPAGDTSPVGSIFPEPDGSLWQKIATQSPFGTTFMLVEMKGPN